MTNRSTIEKLLYTPVEAAHALGVSRSTVYLLMAAGDIPSVRIGGMRKRPDGRWEGSVDVGVYGSGRRRKYVYGRTRAEAVEKLRAVQQNLDDGLPLIDERVTVARFLIKREE